MTNDTKLVYFFAAVLLFLLGGCTPAGSGQRSQTSVKPKFESAVAKPSNLLAVHSIELATLEVAPQLAIAEPAKLRLTESLEQSARSALSFDVLRPHNAAKLKQRSDAVLHTRLFEFSPRLGSAVGVDQPAKVGFVMSLRRASGEELWSARYFVNEQAIFENLFKLGERVEKGKAPRWHSEFELAEQGFGLAFTDLDDRRMSQFRPADGASQVK